MKDFLNDLDDELKDISPNEKGIQVHTENNDNVLIEKVDISEKEKTHSNDNNQFGDSKYPRQNFEFV